MIYAPISPGELLDKITILCIKVARISDVKAISNVKKELALFEEISDKAIAPSSKLTELINRLTKVNEALWDIEDAIREKERLQDFGEEFIALARSVYKTNDERSGIKRSINDLLGSVVIEEKCYEQY